MLERVKEDDIITSITIVMAPWSFSGLIDEIMDQNPELTEDDAKEIFYHFVEEGKLKARFIEYPWGRRKRYFPMKEGKYLRVGEKITHTLTRKMFARMFYVSKDVRTVTPTPFAFLVAFVYSFQPEEFSMSELRRKVEEMHAEYWSLGSAIAKGSAYSRDSREDMEVDYDEITELKASTTGITTGTASVPLNEIQRYILLYEDKKKLEVKQELTEFEISKILG